MILALAGAALLAISWLGEGPPRIAVADLPRLGATSLLMITLCYAALFWGMVHVDSGTGAVLEVILELETLLIGQDLVWGRLADVDHGEATEVIGVNSLVYTHEIPP